MNEPISRIRIYGTEQVAGALWLAMKHAAPGPLASLAGDMFIGERGGLLDNGSFGPKAGPRLTFGIMPYQGEWWQWSFEAKEVKALVRRLPRRTRDLRRRGVTHVACGWFDMSQDVCDAGRVIGRMMGKTFKK